MPTEDPGEAERLDGTTGSGSSRQLRERQASASWGEALDVGEFRRAATGLLAQFRVPASDQEDLVQSVLELYWAKKSQIRSPFAWSLGALRIHCLRYQSAHKTHEVPLDATPEFEVRTKKIASGEWRVVLGSALRRTSKRERAALLLHFISGYSLREVAQLLRSSVPAVKKLIQRGLAAARESS